MRSNHARRLRSFLGVLLLATGSAHADPRDFRLGDGVSEYQRFIVYPHLEKAFAAQERGDADLALREFGRARELLPENPTTALYLADALHRFGKTARAIGLLRAQLIVTPGNATLLARLQVLLAAEQAATGPDEIAMLRDSAQQAIYRRDWSAAEQALAALAGRGLLTADERAQRFNVLLALGRLDAARAWQQQHRLDAPAQVLAWAQGLSTQPGRAAELARWLGEHDPAFADAADERQWIVLLEKTANNGDAAPALRYRPRFAGNRFYHAGIAVPSLLGAQTAAGDAAARTLLAPLPADVLREARFTLALRRPAFDDAVVHARALWEQSRQTAQLDALSFRLQQAGGGAQATTLLLQAWPFAGNDDAGETHRTALFARLAGLLQAHPEQTVAHRQPLAIPSPLPATAGGRGAAAAVFSVRKDCASVRALLGDLSPAYTHADWLRLGDCYHGVFPGLAQYAYAQAWQRGADPLSARALAYAAYDTGDLRTALAAWQSLPGDTLDNEERMAAATTAVSARSFADARRWLDAYVLRGGNQDDRYWWLRAQTRSDAATAVSDLQQAIDLRPDPVYYAWLAERQSAAGDPAAAADSLQRAVHMQPDDSELRAALAAARNQAGQAVAARTELERLLAAEPADDVLLRQLAWIARDQGDNDAARRYSERAIDALRDDPGPRHVFRRLHADLDRRWTFSADALSGTRMTAVADAPDPGTAWRSYSQVAADYRLGPARWRNEQRLDATARVFAGGGSGDSALPVHDPVLGLGLRAKPWRSQPVFAGIEQQWPLTDRGDPDFVARISASFPDGGPRSSEWQPLVNAWLNHNLYLDGAWHTTSGRTALTADYHVGQQRKLARDGATVEPYLHLQATHVADEESDEDLRAGIGVAWRLRFADSVYDAWRHEGRLAVEWQHAFSTYLQESDALVLSAGVRW
ncbi:MAG: NfrA family protein [Pseudomonadota bacterium]